MISERILINPIVDSNQKSLLELSRVAHASFNFHLEINLYTIVN